MPEVGKSATRAAAALLDPRPLRDFFILTRACGRLQDWVSPQFSDMHRPTPTALPALLSSAELLHLRIQISEKGNCFQVPSHTLSHARARVPPQITVLPHTTLEDINTVMYGALEIGVWRGS